MKLLYRSLIRFSIALLFLTPLLVQGQCSLSPGLYLGADTAGCVGVPLILDAGAPYSSYSWSTGGSSQTISVTTAGTYIVTVTDTAGCTGADTIVITTFNSLPSVNLGPDIDTCNTLLVIVDAGSGYSSYLWNDNTTIQTLGITFDGTFSVTITDANGCPASDTINVAFHTSDPSYSLGNGPMFCLGDTGTLNGGSGFLTYNWSNGDTGQIISVVDSGIYSVTVTNQFGCPTTSFPISVTTWPGPPQPIITATGATLNTGVNANYSYQWFLDGNPITNADSSSFIPTLSGMYTVQITDQNGCVSILSLPYLIDIDIDETQISQLVSPNNDGSNDFFNIPELINFPINELVIMNRWGVEVFRMENYDNTWSGIASTGNPVPEGTYYYILDLKDNSEPFVGFFHLIR